MRLALLCLCLIGVPASAAITEQDVAEVAPSVRIERGELVPGPTLPVPPAPGLQGKPFAPEGLSLCDEMSFYRVQWGLPAIFDRMGFKESSCKNWVENWCCHGYWQLHESFWSNIPECEVSNIYDLQGTSAISKQRNACAAKYVYDRSGCGAWSTCPW